MEETAKLAAKLAAKLELVESTENSNLPAVIYLSSDTPTILGRSSKMCRVVLDASPTKSISRRHAEIFCSKGGRRGCDKYTLRDLESTNGVFVNDFKVKEKHLEHGDVVQFGGAADIPVGTRFGGTGSHIRYRFDHKPTPSAAQGSRKRRHPAEPTPDAPEAQRTKLERANTQEAVEALHAISNGDGGHSKNRHDDLDEGGQAGGGDGRCRAGGERGVQLSGGGETPPPSMVTEVLRDAMCGLCSELLLDAGVLPCSHSFCRMCWADHVEEKGTTCPVCMRKMHSSERNPRQCSNLDLLITSIVHKLAGPQELERWNARQQEHGQKQEARAKAQGATPASASSGLDRRGHVNGSMAANTPKAMAPPTPLPTPSPARSVHFAESGGRSNGIARGDNARGGGGSASRQARGDSGGGGGGRAAAKVSVPVPVKCEGCNEAGHEFRECPHRSDGALEGSEDVEEGSDSDSEEEDDGGGEDEDSDSDDA